MQLLLNKPVHRNIKESSTSNGIGRTDEDEWEGFGEDEFEEQVDSLRLERSASLRKDTPKTEKPRKQEKKQKKKAASNLETTRNSFEALGRADDDEATADIEESDGKHDLRIACVPKPDNPSVCVGFFASLFSDNVVSRPHEVLAANCDTTVYHPGNLRWSRRHRKSTDWIWQNASIWNTYLRVLP